MKKNRRRGRRGGGWVDGWGGGEDSTGRKVEVGG